MIPPHIYISFSLPVGVEMKECCKGGLKFKSHLDLSVPHAYGLCGRTWGYSGSRQEWTAELPITPIQKK